MGQFVEKKWNFFPDTDVIAKGSSIIIGSSRAEEVEEYDGIVEVCHAYKLTEGTQISPKTIGGAWWSREPIIITTNGISPEEISIMTPKGIPWRYGLLFEATKIEPVPLAPT